MTEVTRIVHSIQQGEARASEELLSLVYEQLRRSARVMLAAEATGNTLSPTALVHEAYVRLMGGKTSNQWDGPDHFYAAAAEAMRRILIDRARRKKTVRRGGTRKRRMLLDADCRINPDDERVLFLDDALTKLLEQNPVVGQLVKLRYFGGLTVEQSAAALNISPRTAKRYWVYAKAWLQREIEREGDARS